MQKFEKKKLIMYLTSELLGYSIKILWRRLAVFLCVSESEMTGNRSGQANV